MVLVNDEPVTAYEIEQRANFLSANSSEGGGDLKAKAEARWQQITKDPRTNERLQQLLREKGVTTREQAVAIQQEFAKGLQRDMIEQLKREARAGRIPQFKKEATEELIEERLKLQEAKRLGVEVTEAEVDRIMAGLAQRNNMNEAQFVQHLKSVGIDAQTMRERFKASYAWRDVIRRRYGPQISITQRDVDRMIADSASETGEDTVELQLQRITLPMPSNIDQTALAKRFAEAEVPAPQVHQLPGDGKPRQDYRPMPASRTSKRSSRAASPSRCDPCCSEPRMAISCPPQPWPPASRSMPSAAGGRSRAMTSNAKKRWKSCRRENSRSSPSATFATCARMRASNAAEPPRGGREPTHARRS